MPCPCRYPSVSLVWLERDNVGSFLVPAQQAVLELQQDVTQGRIADAVALLARVAAQVVELILLVEAGIANNCITGQSTDGEGGNQARCEQPQIPLDLRPLGCLLPLFYPSDCLLLDPQVLYSPHEPYREIA
jgi:hypothetical protein